MDTAAERQAVVQAGKELVAEGLVARTWGNVSCRVDEKTFAITPSGLCYDSITPDDIVLYNALDGSYEGTRKPSSEKRIHAAAYARFKDANFVIHTHQDYASAIGLAGFDDIRLMDSERDSLGGIALSAYALPGTKKLARSVENAMKTGAHTILMAHHGALIIGKDMAEAFERAKLLENVCKRACKSKGTDGGDKARAESLVKLASEKFANVTYTATPEILQAADSFNVIYAQLDDMAQMIGHRLVCYENANEDSIIKALERADAVLVKNVGAICRADTADDCNALCMLVNKACVCRLHTESYGIRAEIPALEAVLMRQIYLKKYSKRIGNEYGDKKHKELWRTVKFVLFSCSAGVIQLGSFTLMNEFAGFNYWVSYLVALVLSVIWNFTLNRRFTFKSANNVPIAMLKVLGYYCVFTPLSTLLGNYLVETLLWNEYAVTIINMVLNFVTEFLFDRFVVFRDTLDTNDIAKKEQEKEADKA